MRSVEEAIRLKLAKTRDMVGALQAADKSVAAELSAMARCHQRLQSADAHLRSQLGLNSARQQVRGGRAQLRETAVTDEVGRQLHHQQLLLDELLEKAGRCGRLVESASARLLECKGRLSRDLRNKGQALSIDEAVLGLHVGSAGHAIAAAPAATTPPVISSGGNPRRISGGGAVSAGGGTAVLAPPAWAAGSPGGRRKWEGDAAALIAGAQQLVAESGRLRKKVKQVLLELSTAVESSAHAVNSSLADRIQDTRRTRAQLQERLRQVEAETLKAAQEQVSLRRSIEEKR